MDSPPESWYNPPERHIIDACGWCHNNHHEMDDSNYWAKRGCYACYVNLEEQQIKYGEKRS